MSSSLVLHRTNLNGLSDKGLSLRLDLGLTERRSKESHIFDHPESAESLLCIHRLMVDPLSFSCPTGVLAAIVWIPSIGPLQTVVHWHITFFQLFEMLETIIKEHETVDLFALLQRLLRNLLLRLFRFLFTSSLILSPTSTRALSIES